MITAACLRDTLILIIGAAAPFYLEKYLEEKKDEQAEQQEQEKKDEQVEQEQEKKDEEAGQEEEDEEEQGARLECRRSGRAASAVTGAGAAAAADI